jgi:hypothetical protein
MEMMTHALHDGEYRTDRTGGWSGQTESREFPLTGQTELEDMVWTDRVQGLDFFPKLTHLPFTVLKPSITAPFPGPNTYRQEESFF